MRINRILIFFLAIGTGICFYLLATSFQKSDEAIGGTSITEELTPSEVIRLSAEWHERRLYVQRGGDYEGEQVETFEANGLPYRYLAKTISTKEKLLAYLTEAVTQEFAERFIEDSGYIEHNGRMAQPEADGGSIAQWDKAEVQFVKEEDEIKVYELVVPLGDSPVSELFTVDFAFVENRGYRINDLTYEKQFTVDIPGNINPAFVFLKYLLIDSEVAKGELLDTNSFDVDAFKKGINVLEIRNIDEYSKGLRRVQFKADFYVELDENYSGDLQQGDNQLYFLIENTDVNEFKIIGISTNPIQ